MLLHYQAVITLTGDYITLSVVTAVDALLHNLTDPVNLSEWTRIQKENGYKKISLVTQDVSATDFKNTLSQEYLVFVKCKDLVTNQYGMVHEIKDNLNEETYTGQMDFAEHFISTNGEEIQSAYFNKNSVTLHPIVHGALQEERSG